MVRIAPRSGFQDTIVKRLQSLSRRTHDFTDANGEAHLSSDRFLTDDAVVKRLGKCRD
jgi:hypothetical protein